MAVRIKSSKKVTDNIYLQFLLVIVRHGESRYVDKPLGCPRHQNEEQRSWTPIDIMYHGTL